MIKAVLFDLDGTLLDTAKDLGNALNHVLETNGKNALDFSISRPYVSGGTPALINLGFGIKSGEAKFEPLKEAFLAFYRDNLCQYTKPFAGINRALEEIETRKLKWGIVTNKPGYLTDPLLKELKFDSRSSVTISGDTFQQRKPDPYPLLQAAKVIETLPEHVVYVGDDERDIVAAKAAGMVSVSVGWGYPGGQDPKSWHADYHIEHSEQLLDFVISL
ncbi:MAG: HAD-IA family hydrolase [Kangiellaceae bacterium]|nr:HAD-IA family hydrolase [Kangiellaceae bacterium]